MKFYNKISELYDKEISASGLAVFRIFYSIVLFCEVGQLFYFRHLVFDYVPYLAPYDVNFSPALIVWMAVIVFLVFGAYTRYAAIANYLFSLVFISSIHSFEYHMFYAYMGVNFLFMFIDISCVYSIDRLRKKIQSGSSYLPKKVSVLNYYILVLVGVGFVYFDSILFKYGSHVWLNGLGLWLPASIPQMTHVNTSFILNIKWLALGLGYLTLAFETIFIFVFFRKKWRPWLVLVGVGLHIGIIIEFPIPWFGFGVIALYCLLIPVSWWQKIGERLSFSKISLTIFYDKDCPLCRRTKINLEHFDWFKALDFKSVQEYADQTDQLKEIEEEKLLSDIYAITSKGKILKGIKTYSYAFRRMPLFLPLGIFLSIPGIRNLANLIYGKVAINRSSGRCTGEICSIETPKYKEVKSVNFFTNLSVKQLKAGFILVGIIILIMFQLNTSYNSLLVNRAKTSLGINQSYPGKVVQKLSFGVRLLTKTFLGITNHAVFMDYHFEGYNHIVAVELQKDDGTLVWLPIIDKNGQPDWYIYNFNWVKWTFRVDAPMVNQTELRNGIKRFTAFWAEKQGYNLSNLTFNIMVKKIDSARRWKPDFLNKQIQKPWITAGHAYWKNQKFTADIANIEKM